MCCSVQWAWAFWDHPQQVANNKQNPTTGRFQHRGGSLTISVYFAMALVTCAHPEVLSPLSQPCASNRQRILNERENNHGKSCTRNLHNTPKHKLKSDWCESCPGISETTGGNQTSGPHAVWIFVHVLFQAILTIRDLTGNSGQCTRSCVAAVEQTEKKNHKRFFQRKPGRDPGTCISWMFPADCRPQTKAILASIELGQHPETGSNALLWSVWGQFSTSVLPGESLGTFPLQLLGLC